MAMFSKPMENWIKHSIGPFNLPGRKLTDAPNNRVPIGVAFGQKREDDYDGGSANKFFIQLHATNGVQFNASTMRRKETRLSNLKVGFLFIIRIWHGQDTTVRIDSSS